MLRNFQPALTIVNFKICLAHFKIQLVLLLIVKTLI
jgi:hypothetical protein